MRVEVSVPATVANLGPGFDCLGVAVGRFLRIGVAAAAKNEVVGDVPPLPDSLIHRAFVAAHEAGGSDAPAVRIEALETYPSARGLGASASAIVAGLVAARSFSDLELTDSELSKLAKRIEGHSDNVLPALFGGLVLSLGDSWMRFEPTPQIRPLIAVAPNKLKTSESRRVLPAEFPRADTIANASATAALVAVLAGLQSPETLMAATEDRIHEPYRLPLIEASFELHAALRRKGIATALSGAGPSLICLVPADTLEDAKAMVVDSAPSGWKVLDPGWDLNGAQVRKME